MLQACTAVLECQTMLCVCDGLGNMTVQLAERPSRYFVMLLGCRSDL